jgi:hypothetical protein
MKQRHLDGCCVQLRIECRIGGRGMINLATFGWGCLGSGAVEIVHFCHALRISRSHDIPLLYRSTAYLVGRVALVLVAGGIATASEITRPIQAVAIGAGAPQLVLALSRLRFVHGAISIDTGQLDGQLPPAARKKGNRC